jgi:hypothetical protein
VGTRSSSSGARSRDPLALPTLQLLYAVIASEAKQSMSREEKLDCFVAPLLAMTAF